MRSTVIDAPEGEVTYYAVKIYGDALLKRHEVVHLRSDTQMNRCIREEGMNDFQSSRKLNVAYIVLQWFRAGEALQLGNLLKLGVIV